MIYANDQKYSLVLDGTGDNTAALQKLLDHAQATQQGIMLPAGVYRTGTLHGHSGLSLIGEWPTLLLHPATDRNAPILSLSGVADVELRSLCFDGDMLGPRNNDALMSLSITRNARVIDCSVCNVPYIGIAVYGATDTLIEDFLATHCGKSEVTPEGGAAIWLGGDDQNPMRGVTILRGLFEDLEWSAIYNCTQLSTEVPSDVHIIDITTRRTKESALFLYGSAGLRVTGATIEDVTVKNISACGIETGGRCTLEGNTIRRTQAPNINLQHGIDARVSDNVLDGSIAHTSIAFDPETAHALGAPRNITVKDNRFVGQNGRISFYGQDGAPKVSGVIIADNTGLALDGGLDLDTQFMGANFFVDRNLIGGKI